MTDGTRLDVKALYAALDAKRRNLDLSWRLVAKEAGVSASTLTRMTQDKRPDVDSFAALVQWLGMSADRFLGVAQRQAEPFGEFSVALRAKKELTEEDARALEELLQATYRRMVKMQR
jgi:transcriptional regulator with XRE-family HTH domain